MSPTREQMREAERRAWARAVTGEDGRPHEDGRLLLGWLLREGSVFSRLDVRHADGSIDPLSMARLEGRRSLALQVMHLLELGLEDMVTDGTDRGSDRDDG